MKTLSFAYVAKRVKPLPVVKAPLSLAQAVCSWGFASWTGIIPWLLAYALVAVFFGIIVPIHEAHAYIPTYDLRSGDELPIYDRWFSTYVTLLACLGITSSCMGVFMLDSAVRHRTWIKQAQLWLGLKSIKTIWPIFLVVEFAGGLLTYFLAKGAVHTFEDVLLVPVLESTFCLGLICYGTLQFQLFRGIPCFLPHSKLGLVSFVLAAVLAQEILFKVWDISYLARVLSPAIWTINLRGGDLMIMPSQKATVAYFDQFWFSTLPFRLLPATAATFMLGAISLFMSKRSRYFGLLAVLICTLAVAIAILVFVCNYIR